MRISFRELFDSINGWDSIDFSYSPRLRPRIKYQVWDKRYINGNLLLII